MNKAFISGVAVAVLVGLAFGSFVFPHASTLTTTSTEIINHQLTVSGYCPGSLAGECPTVTLTAVVVDVYYYVGVCTTVSGTPVVTYTNGPGGQLTTVVTVHNDTLPQAYFAVVTTDYTSISASQTTQPFSGPC